MSIGASFQAVSRLFMMKDDTESSFTKAFGVIDNAKSSKFATWRKSIADLGIKITFPDDLADDPPAHAEAVKELMRDLLGRYKEVVENSK